MMRKRASKEIRVYDTFDRVGAEIPQLPQISKLVVVPMKVVYVNQCADDDANIIRMFRNVEDFSDFCEQYWIQLE